MALPYPVSFLAAMVASALATLSFAISRDASTAGDSECFVGMVLFLAPAMGRWALCFHAVSLVGDVAEQLVSPC